jgi:8-oxo-dGTP pyrophosphatase MutT (NUDIX family)
MKENGWETLSVKEVYDNPWIQISHREVRNPNGGDGIYGLVHFKNLALGIIPVSADGHTWIVGQHRYPLNNKYSWEIIEGGGPLDIDPILSAKRELLEETGLSAKKWTLLQEMELSNSATNERALIYLAEDLTLGEATPDETELLSLKKISLKELCAMVLEGEIIDSLSVAGVLKLMQAYPHLIK